MNITPKTGFVIKDSCCSYECSSLSLFDPSGRVVQHRRATARSSVAGGASVPLLPCVQCNDTGRALNAWYVCRGLSPGSSVLVCPNSSLSPPSFPHLETKQPPWEAAGALRGLPLEYPRAKGTQWAQPQSACSYPRKALAHVEIRAERAGRSGPRALLPAPGRWGCRPPPSTPVIWARSTRAVVRAGGRAQGCARAQPSPLVLSRTEGTAAYCHP